MNVSGDSGDGTCSHQLEASAPICRPRRSSSRIWRGSNEIDPPPEQDFGFGVHQWGLHADDRQVIADMVEPRPNLFTCGEAFSDYQGWVEGALRSADLVLATEGFGGLRPICEQYRLDHGRTANDVVAEKYDAWAALLIGKYIDPGPPPPARAMAAAEEAPVEHEDFGVNFTFLVPSPTDRGE